MEEFCLLAQSQDYLQLPFLYSPGNDATRSGLGPLTSLYIRDNPTKTFPKAKLIWTNPQMRLPSQITLGYIKLSTKADWCKRHIYQMQEDR